MKEVRLTGAAPLSHKSLVGTCDQVAALVHAEYRAEIEQFRVSLDRSLSKSVTRLQSGVVKTVTEYAAAPISEALTERSIQWVVMQMEETKERQQAAQAADIQAKLPPRHTRDTAHAIAQTQPKQPSDVPSAAMPSTPPSTTPAVTSAAIPGDAPQHQVKPHDNLHKIAKQYGTTAEALKSANPQLANPDLIYPGQMLNLPAGSMMTPFQLPTPANHNVPPSSGPSMSWGTCPVPDVEDPWNRPAYGMTPLIFPGDGLHWPQSPAPYDIQPFLLDADTQDETLSFFNALSAAEETARLKAIDPPLEAVYPEDWLLGGGAAAKGALKKLLPFVKKLFTVIDEPSAPTGATDSGELFFGSRQLQRKFKHAEDFGVEGNYNPAQGEKFKTKLIEHMQNDGIKKIKGELRGDDVIHYFNPKTECNAVFKPNGEWISGWKLEETQLEYLKKTGKIGGGS